jgi:hypothetical protein
VTVTLIAKGPPGVDEPEPEFPPTTPLQPPATIKIVAIQNRTKDFWAAFMTLFLLAFSANLAPASSASSQP